MTDTAPPCRALVLFGATGDLAKRMLWPSLYALHCDGLLPEPFQLIGAAKSALDHGTWVERVRESILSSANAKLFDEATFAAFSGRLAYVSVDVQSAESVAAIKSALKPADGAQDGAHQGGVIFYLSTGPQLFGPIALALNAAGLVDTRSRIVIEKPIGTDARTANEVNSAIGSAFAENQVFRIDHYLGKEAVQNLLALRFANAIFEPLWNANAIEQVQISVSESVGVDGRWPFYDSTGALRDMVQSHLLQLLCLVAMEPPASFTPSAVRNEKVKVLWSLRPITAANAATHTVRGQYTAGHSAGEPAKGYLEETGARPASDTETFVAVKAEIDNWRWAGVPFYLRTGKRMTRRSSEIAIQFKAAPYNIFAGIGATLSPNTLLIKLQPEEMITLTLMHKKPGMNEVKLAEVPLNLSVGEAFETSRRRIAYERMLLDVLRDNSALFLRRDEIEAAWQWVDGIIAGWKEAGLAPKPYSAGTWGPSAAIALAERNGHSWHE
ncbi:MAG: glucose-6-phosphate dehydrogenase [Betaproteobacteria bacterium]|nr:glucose-6-phosphate dehydrogenase [Betaproteobacteria bacterium]